MELNLGLVAEYKFKNVDELPRSDILFDHEAYAKLSDKIVALYHKYISASADFQLNLSAQVRTRWIVATSGLLSPINHRRGMPSLGRRLSTQFKKARSRQSSILKTEEKRINHDDVQNKVPSKIQTNSEVLQEIPSTGSDFNSPEDINRNTPTVPSTDIVYDNGQHGKVFFDTPTCIAASAVDGAIDFVKTITMKRQKLNNGILNMSLNEANMDYSIDPLSDCDIDIDLNVFLPLIQRVLEQCHLLLMDSFSRFKYERDRKVKYDMNDDETVKTHTVRG